MCGDPDPDLDTMSEDGKPSRVKVTWPFDFERRPKVVPSPDDDDLLRSWRNHLVANRVQQQKLEDEDSSPDILLHPPGDYIPPPPPPPPPPALSTRPFKFPDLVPSESRRGWWSPPKTRPPRLGDDDVSSFTEEEEAEINLMLKREEEERLAEINSMLTEEEDEEFTDDDFNHAIDLLLGYSKGSRAQSSHQDKNDDGFGLKAEDFYVGPKSKLPQPRLPMSMLRGPKSHIRIAKCKNCDEKNVVLAPPTFACPFCGKVPEALEFIHKVQKYPDQDDAGDGSLLMSEKEADIYFSTLLNFDLHSVCPYKEKVCNEGVVMMNCDLCGLNNSHWTAICAMRYGHQHSKGSQAYVKRYLTDSSGYLKPGLKTFMTVEGKYIPGWKPSCKISDSMAEFDGIQNISCQICEEVGHWVGTCRFNRTKISLQCLICSRDGHTALMCPYTHHYPRGTPIGPGYVIACSVCPKVGKDVDPGCKLRVIPDLFEGSAPKVKNDLDTNQLEKWQPWDASEKMKRKILKNDYDMP